MAGVLGLYYITQAFSMSNSRIALMRYVAFASIIVLFLVFILWIVLRLNMAAVTPPTSPDSIGIAEPPVIPVHQAPFRNMIFRAITENGKPLAFRPFTLLMTCQDYDPDRRHLKVIALTDSHGSISIDMSPGDNFMNANPIDISLIAPAHASSPLRGRIILLQFDSYPAVLYEDYYSTSQWMDTAYIVYCKYSTETTLVRAESQNGYVHVKLHGAFTLADSPISNDTAVEYARALYRHAESTQRDGFIFRVHFLPFYLSNDAQCDYNYSGSFAGLAFRVIPISDSYAGINACMAFRQHD